MEAYERILLAVMIFAAAAQIEIGNMKPRMALPDITPPGFGSDELPCASTAAGIDMACVLVILN